MPKHNISPYQVKLRQDHKTGLKVRTEDLWKLDDLGAMNPGLKEFDNFMDLMKGFAEHLRDVGYLNENAKRGLTATEFATGSGNFATDSEARTIEVELVYGRYNRVADHTDKDAFEPVNPETPYDNRREGQRDRNTLAETRLHFLAHVPTNTNRSAFFVLHSYGQDSVKIRLKDALNRYILEKYDSNSATFALGEERRKNTFKLEMNTVAGPDLIEQLKSSKIVGFEVYKRDTNVPEYMSEGTDLSNEAEGDLKIQYTSDNMLSDLRTKNASLWEKIRNEEYPLAELVDDDPSRANALIETPEDDTRRINISRDEIRMEKVINPVDLEYNDDNGRVKISSISEASRRFLNTKLQEIGAQRLSEKSLLS